MSISLTEASKKLKIPVYANVRSWHEADVRVQEAQQSPVEK